jgi:wobble nucleotide-excising tRNase
LPKTSALNTFLGRQELLFEPHKTKVLDAGGKQVEIEDGYIIKRNNKPVTHLSEGEKTAIAFVYFTIHLNDPAFNKAKDIVVIDDPISSLDSASMFQAFSFLKNSVKDIHQVFILTHNYDFLRLVLNWLTYRTVKKDACFYMLKNKDVSDERVAYIDELDKDLQDFETEYHYLFNLIYKFQSDGTIASVYHMPNIARKVLDTFLMFRVPNSDSTYEKLEYLKPLFDENKITAIYKFTNDQSHVTGKGFDPSLVPETQKVVKYLLEFIEATFPDHYKVLTT